jgi:diguanylate cyclase
MQHRIDQDTAATMAKKTLMMMSKREIPLFLENYLVWFAYSIGVNPDLDADIKRIIQEGSHFSEEVNLDLFKRHFGTDTRLKKIEDTQKKIQVIMKDVLDGILHTQNFTSDYRDKLTGFTTQLNDAKNLDEVHKVVTDLMLVTVAVIHDSEQLKEHLVQTTIKSENLQKDLEKAQQEVLIDPLTQLLNRKAFDGKIRTYMKAFREEGVGFSVVIMDIDHFKQFNDLHGHLLGDQVLRFMGSLLSREIKGKDFVARYGGEEFIILLSGTPLEMAHVVADNIRKSLDGFQLKYIKTGQLLGKISVSAGVSAVREGDTEESLVSRADDAMYVAKQSGRNNVKSELYLLQPKEHPEIVAPSPFEFLKI